MAKTKTNEEKIRETYYAIYELFRVDKRLTLLRQIIHVAMVFFGFVMVWYGVYSFILATWPINIPIVAIILGVALLYINGRVNSLG